MPTASNGGVTLAYELDGPAGAETVVFVEGLGVGRWQWHWQREALLDDYRVLRWDNRGTGESDAPPGPYTVAEMAADLEAVLADAGVERAHVVGASLGGMIAQRYGLAYDRAATLSLLCTTPGGPDAIPVPEETQARMFAEPPGGDERERIKHRMRPGVSEGFFEADPDRAERIVDWRLEQDADDPAREAQAAGALTFDASEELGDLDVPTVLLHGDADRVVPVENARLLRERLPECRLEIREGGHHYVFVEDASWVNDRLRSFLDAHPIETDARSAPGGRALNRETAVGNGDDETTVRNGSSGGAVGDGDGGTAVGKGSGGSAEPDGDDGLE